MLEEEKTWKINTIREEIDSGSYKSQHCACSAKYSSNVDYLVDKVLVKRYGHQKIVKKTSWKKILSIVLACFVVLAAIPYVLPPLYGDFGSDVSISLDPDGVRLNETLFVNVAIPFSYNITNVSADMAGVETVSLDLIDNSSSLHLWSGFWLVGDIVPGEHIITVSAWDVFNVSYSAGTGLSVLSDEIPANESSEPGKNEIFPPEVDDVNVSENETIIPVGLNLSLQSDKSVYVVNEAVMINGIVTYNDSLINTSVNLLITGPGFNLSERLNTSNGRFNYQFILSAVGNYIVRGLVSYLNETVQEEIFFDVSAMPIENVTQNVSDLLIWDDTDSQVRYVEDQVTFYANYSCENLSILNASCLISFDVGTWTPPIAMSFGDGLYVYSRSFDIAESFEYQVWCSAVGFENKTAFDEFIVSEDVTDVTEVSIVDPRVDEQVYALPGTSFYVERTIDGLNGTDVVFAPLFSDALTVEKIEVLKEDGSGEKRLRISEDDSPQVFTVGSTVSNVERRIDGLRERLPIDVKQLNHASYSQSISLVGPVTVRIWFKAPSWGEVITGTKPSSGRISYLVFSNKTSDFEGSTWWNSNWEYRKLITVNSSQVDADLSNFPILVNITDSDLASKAQDDGDDIAFVLWSDNTTRLNHEIELFNGTSGELVCWVNVTSLSSSEDTKIWMYYNNSGSSSQQNATGVWDSNYIAVWHLNETSGTHYDSTSNNEDSTAVVGVTQDAIGFVDGCDEFDGSSSYIDITMNLPSTVTISAWAYSTASSFSDMLWCIDSDNGGPDLFYTGTQICLNTWDSAGNPFCNIPSDADEWHLYSTVIQSGNTNLYIDDQLGGSATYRNPTGSDFHISSSAGYDWEGRIDEVRISNIARNTGWINTSYNTMNHIDTFLNLSTEEQAAPIVSNPVPGDGASGISVPPISFNITISDPSGDSMNITWRTNESGSWETFNVTDGGGSGVSDGTYNVTNTSWVDTNLTKYWWSVNVTDGTSWINNTYSFSTRPQNYVPTISNVYPSNYSTGIDLQVTCYIQVTDLDEDIMTVYWYNSTDGTNFTYQQTNSSVNSGDTIYWNYTQANIYLTTYYWKIAVNDTKDNTTEWYNFTTRSGDSTKPSSNVTTITPYWHGQSSNPLTIICTDAKDNTGGEGIKNVTLYYYNSTDNSSWSGPWNFTVDEDPWVECSWSFTFPNSTGYYRLYSRTADNASPANIEDPPVTNDTECGYDIVKPASSVDTISPYNVTSPLLTINATASDSHSGVKNVTLWYRYSPNNFSWWNTGWSNRKAINLNVSSGSTAFNYQILLNVTYDSYMNSNFSDIRFINYSDNTTELDYWIESKSDGDWANIWVEISSTIDTTNQTLAWMYYGNHSAESNSNGTATFEFFDDFPGASLDTSTWTATGSYSVNDGIAITTGCVYTDTTVASSPQDLTFEMKAYYSGPDASYSGLEIADAQSTSGSNGGANALAYHMTGDGGQDITLWGADGTVSSYNIVSGGSLTPNPTLNTDYIFGYSFYGSSQISYFYQNLDYSEIDRATYSGTWSDPFYLWLGYFTGSTAGGTNIDDITVSWVRIRKYSSSEPTYYIGSGETWLRWDNISNPDTDGSDGWSWIFDFPNGTGYYEFYCIANDTVSNQEDAPGNDDAKCNFNPDTTINVTPEQWDIGTTTIGF